MAAGAAGVGRGPVPEASEVSGARLRHRLSAARRTLWRLLRPPAPTISIQVPIASLRCQVTAFGERQGFSGAPIGCFPPHGFFATALDDSRRAADDFADWYRLWFVEREGWRVPKRRGGMQGGSLDRTVRHLFAERHGRLPGSIDEVGADLVAEAIRVRVAYYLDLFASIRRHGMEPGSALPCSPGEGVYYLRDGHHRASALDVLGVERALVEVAEER
jgi:hypothetical protein